MLDLSHHGLYLRTAARWGISREVALHEAARDKNCIYCRRDFDLTLENRAAVPSWEHIVNDVSLTSIQNVGLCCVSCNSSKGKKKSVKDWLNSAYCQVRGITYATIAPLVRNSLGGSEPPA